MCVCVGGGGGGGHFPEGEGSMGNLRESGTPCAQIHGDVMSQQRVGISGSESPKGQQYWGLLELWWFALSMASRCWVQFVGMQSRQIVNG